LIVSTIQVVADGHGWERWGNFPRERQRLYDLIRDTGANGVIILSGDRHVGAIYRQTDGVPYPLIEITSSGINQVFPGNREPGPNRIGAVFGAANFGTIDVDWSSGSVTLSVRGMNGESVRRVSVALQDLRPSGTARRSAAILVLPALALLILGVLFGWMFGGFRSKAR